jgi:predicted RNA-binding Zn-ribbon protein involved in translation (DUF1610 family)
MSEKKPRQFKSYLEGRVTLSGRPLYVIKKLFAVLARIDGEIPVQLDENALSIRVMNRASTQMADCVFPKSIFKRFSIGFVERFRPAILPARLCVNIDDILHAIKGSRENDEATIDFKPMFVRIKKDEKVKLYRPGTCPNCGLQVNEGNNKREANKRGKNGNLYTCAKCGWNGRPKGKWRKFKGFEYKVKGEDSSVSVTVEGDAETEKFPVTLHDNVPNMTPLPAMNFSTVQRLASQEFHRKIRKMKQFKYLAITGSREGIAMEGLSEDLERQSQSNRAQITIKRDSEILQDARGQDPQRAVFSMRHFEKLIPASKGIADLVDLEWSTDQPIKITWYVNALAEATVRFFLAPSTLKSGNLQ